MAGTRSREVLLAALDQLLVRAETEDGARGLLTEQAKRDAADLAAVTDPANDLPAAIVLGWFHLKRFGALPKGVGEDDLAAALMFFGPAYQAAPGAVPEFLRQMYQEMAESDARMDRLNKRAIELEASYDRGGDLAALIEAAGLWRNALDALPADDPNYPGMAANLALALRRQFEVTGDTALLEEAVEKGRAAAAAAPVGHAGYVHAHSVLAAALMRMFQQTGDPALLTEATEMNRAVLHASPISDSDHGRHLSNLGVALQMLFEVTGDLAVLAEAVEKGRAAADLIPSGDPCRAGALSNLGGALARLAGRTGDLALAEEAITRSRTAVSAALPGDPDRGGHLATLGVALWEVFLRTGNTTLLEEAVEAFGAAVDTVSASHLSYAPWLGNLAMARVRLSERTGDSILLDEAAAAARVAVAVIPVDHFGRAACLSNLGSVLLQVFVRTDATEVLAEAADAARAAVQATPIEHFNHAVYLSNLGNILYQLYEQTSEPRWSHEAVTALLAARAATPADHPHRAAYLNNLGNVLRALSERTGSPARLAEAAEMVRAAVRATPADHPDRAKYQYNLGMILRALFQHTGDTSLHDEAYSCDREAAENTVAPVMIRISAYRRVAAHVAQAGDGEAALDALEAAIELAQRLAPRSLARSDREHWLKQLAGLAGEAAAAALTNRRPGRAVELLEQTRGMLVADAIDARSSDLTRLKAAEPGLAKAVETLRDRLDSLDHPYPDTLVPLVAADMRRGSGPAMVQQAARNLAADRRAAHKAWNELMASIRAVDGFADFLRAPRITDLATQAREGPVVFVSANRARCDALIVCDTPEQVRVVPLTALTEDAVHEHANRLLAAQDQDLERAQGASRSAQANILGVLAWMWDMIAGPVLEALRYTTTPAEDEEWPRIWWCPVGVVAFLPLHAAGHHADVTSEDNDRRSRPRTVLDRVVSSYAPTLRGLAYIHNRQRGSIKTTAIIIAAPDVPGFSSLPHANSEARALSMLIPGARLITEPTRQEVLAALPRYFVAHFACHGAANWTDPASSHLVLRDHAVAPLTVADVSAVKLAGGLAYLSACETTVTSSALVDETIHITGAFHLAGYEHVIGTLWPVNDYFAGRLAKDFYAQLTQEGTMTIEVPLAPRALHHAIRRLRHRIPALPAIWAAHIHVGI